jgi:hypothetical protein
LIEECNFFEESLIDCDCWVGFVWGVVGARNLCSNWVEFFIELRFNSLKSYFVLDFVHVGFVLRG